MILIKFRLLIVGLLLLLIGCSENNLKTSGDSANDYIDNYSIDKLTEVVETTHEIINDSTLSDVVEDKISNDNYSIDKVTDSFILDSYKDMSSESSDVSCNYTGQLIDENEKPLKGVMLVLCQASDCNFAQSDDNGMFGYDNIPSAEAALKIIGAVIGYTSMSIPFKACPQSNNDLGQIMLFPLGKGEIVSAASGGVVQANKDIKITLPPGIQFPNFEEQAEVIATEIPADKLHPWLAADLNLQRVFTFEPYGTELSSPSSLEISLPKQKGKNAILYAVKYETGAFVKLYEGKVNNNGIFVISAKGPEKLTMLGVKF